MEIVRHELGKQTMSFLMFKQKDMKRLNKKENSFL